MPELLFKLRNVPDDEAEEVRELLKENAIDYYETSAGNWGVSLPALWLKTDRQLAVANQLLEDYQKERVNRIREEYAKLKAEGKNRTLLDEFRENPLRFIVYIAIVIALIYFPTTLFIGMLDS